MDREERLEKKKQKRIKKALRSYKWRPFKNFLWWFTGIISSFIIFVGAIVAGVALIPINTYTGGNNDGIVSEDIASATILDLFMNLDKYGTADIPLIKKILVDNVDNGELGKYVEVDYEKFDALTFSSLGGGLAECFKVVASLDSLGVSGMLGDLGKLTTLTEFKEVEGAVDTTASDFNAKLYYYDQNQTVSAGVGLMSAIQSGEKSFARAFDDNGNRIAPANATLYYGAITKISILDAIDLLDETFGRVEVIELLNMAGAGANDEDGLINKIFEGKKLSDLGSITADDLKLADVLGGTEEDQIYKVLSSATGIAWNEITLANLTDGLDVNKVTLSTFLGEDAGAEGEIGNILSKALNGKAYNEITISDLSSEDFDINNVTLETFSVSEDILKIICQAVIVDDGEERPTTETLNVGHLGSINMDTVSITELLGEETDDNKELYEILRSITNKGAEEDVYLSDLKGDVTFDSIKLETVLKRKDADNNPINVNIWEIIDAAVTDKNANGTIDVSDLSSLDYNKIKLSVVMKETTADSDIAKILVSATTANEWKEVTVGHLNNFTPNDINLSTVMKETTADSDIAKILVSATTANEWKDVTVGHLNNFKPENITLETVLKRKDADNKPINEKIWLIIDSAVTDKNENGTIDVSDLSSLDYNKIKLNDVMPYDADNADGVTNSKLYAVIEDVTGQTYDVVTLGHLNNFNTNLIKINTVMPKTEENAELYEILMDITGETDYKEISLQSLTSFTINELHLSTVLGDSINPTLESVLCQALTDDNGNVPSFDSIMVGDISSAKFDIGKVSLSTVMTKTENTYGNAILDTLLADTENPVTIANVGERISGLSLYEAYGKECFKEYSTPGATFVGNDTWFALEYIDTNGDGENDHYAFVHEEQQYFYNNPTAKKYGLCKDDGIWLLLCFKGVDFEDDGGEDTDGRPEKYVVSDFTLGSLESGATSLSETFKSATIQQLIDAGIIPESNAGYNDRLYTLTLVDAVAELSEAFDKLEEAGIA